MQRHSDASRFTSTKFSFEFVVNLKTAKQIGITIPQWTLMKADKVIQRPRDKARIESRNGDEPDNSSDSNRIRF